jgi:hypothetical protein
VTIKQACECGKEFAGKDFHDACDKIMDHHFETNWQCCAGIAEARASYAWDQLNAKGLFQQDRENGWFGAFIGCALATLLAIGVSNAIGVGHSWPFAVIVPLLIATVTTGVMTCIKTK